MVNKIISSELPAFAVNLSMADLFGAIGVEVTLVSREVRLMPRMFIVILAFDHGCRLKPSKPRSDGSMDIRENIEYL